MTLYFTYKYVLCNDQLLIKYWLFSNWSESTEMAQKNTQFPKYTLGFPNKDDKRVV